MSEGDTLTFDLDCKGAFISHFASFAIIRSEEANQKVGSKVRKLYIH